MGVPTSWRTIEIMQDCSYGFTLDYVKKLVSEWSSIQDYAFILHDKDFKKDGSPRNPHIHLMIRFKNSVPTSAILSKLKGVCEIQQLEKMKNWNKAMAYLTHDTPTARSEGKHHYDDAEVCSNFEWTLDKEKGMVDQQGRIKEIISLIDGGFIREYNYYEHISMEEYVRYKKQIDLAFKYRIDRIEGANRSMECIYIKGESGTGKTTYAKRICEDKGYSYYVSSGSNDVLDGYKGQDALILDDLRPSCMGLSDLLKLLDNNTSSSVRSRYRNKVLECKLIIITTTLDIKSFFKNVFESEDESRVQLLRRCKTYIEMDIYSMNIFAYDSAKRNYIYVGKADNPIEYVRSKASVEDAKNNALNLLGDTVKIDMNNEYYEFKQVDLDFDFDDL